MKFEDPSISADRAFAPICPALSSNKGKHLSLGARLGMRARRWGTIWVLGFAWSAAVAQAPVEAPSPVPPVLANNGYAVTGRVICGDTQRPARFAQVNLIPATDGDDAGGRGGRRTSARTDLDGNFSMNGVAAGDYFVAGQLSGYVNETQQVQAALNAGSDAVAALTGVPLVHVGAGGGSADVTLQRGGVIAGTVVWDDGSPAGGIQISAQPVTPTGVQSTSATQAGNGFGRNGPNGGGGGFSGGQSDDRGHFRLSGLLPGSYLVRAGVQAPAPVRGTGRGFAPTLNLAVYAPDKFRRTDAVPITLAGSEERPDISITLGMAGLHSVSGTVGSTGAAVRSGTLSLTDQTDSTLSRNGFINADGSFVIPYVPPGNYNLQVNASAQATGTGGRGGSTQNSGSAIQFQPLQVSVTVANGDVTGLSLNATPAAGSQ